jgi:PAS domain S-box-containing protein
MSQLRLIVACAWHTISQFARPCLPAALWIRPDAAALSAANGCVETTIDTAFSRDRRTAGEARFAEILAIADDAIISVDAARSITLFNRGAERIFGYRAAEVLGKPLELLLPERFRAGHGEHVGEFGRAPEAARVMAQRREIFGRRKDGTEFPAEASISKTHAGGELTYTVILRDVSERKQAQAALQRAHDELERRVAERTAELQEKNQHLRQEILERQRAQSTLAAQARELARSNADLEQFAYVASHDLQEPLRMVASYAQLLAKRYRGKLDGDADEFIEFVVDGAMRMQRLINDLLAFSRVGTRAKAFRPTPLARAVQHVLSNLELAIRDAGAQISVSELPTVWGDETQLELLIQNLVNNAIKFRRDEAPQVAIAARPGEGEWIFSVTDNGIGIEPQYAQRIFVIFQRLHSAAEYPGTGIGLAICKKIAERHGGRIWMESLPGRGSTFHFSLPMRDETTDEHEPQTD